MVSLRMRSILISSISVVACAWACAASARPLYPQSPSVVLNIEALRDLKQQGLSSSPFGNAPFGNAPLSRAPIPPIHPASAAASDSQVPLMNRPYVPAPQGNVSAAPYAASIPNSPPTTNTTRISLREYQSQRGRTPQGYKIVASRPDGYGSSVPVASPVVSARPQAPMPPVIRDEEPLLPKPKKPSVRTDLPPVAKLKSVDAKDGASAEPPPVPKMPDVAKLTEPETGVPGIPTATPGDLPEPDIADIDFEDFPKLKPLPENDSALPEISPPTIAMPQVPRLPNKPAQESAKSSDSSGLMPSLNKGIDEFISKNQEQSSPSSGKAVSRLPKTPEITPPAPTPIPELPEAIEMPADASQEIAALPNMPVDFPTLQASPIAAPATPAASGAALLSLTFAATENEVPVSGQKQLATLATQLIASGQAVNIEPYVKGASDQDMVANRIATSRAFSVRTFLIDKGVKAENLTIDKRRINTDVNAIEKVDIVAK